MGQKILIGLAGPAGVGKDTAAKYIADTFNVVQYALAGPIKDALEAMGFPRKEFDNDTNKDVPIPYIDASYRKLAQTLGTEWGRAIHPDFWLELARRKYDYMAAYGYSGLVISDVRFPNEAAWVRQHGLLIHIAGPARRPIAADGAAHASEAGLERVQGDVIVTNTGSLTFLFGQLNQAVNRTFFN